MFDESFWTCTGQEYFITSLEQGYIFLSVDLLDLVHAHTVTFADSLDILALLHHVEYSFLIGNPEDCAGF